jgi:serine/threonine-protein kinase
MAAKALGRLKTAEAASALATALRDREWWVRANAADALAQLGPDGLDVLTLMLDDHDAFARDSALAALEASGELTRQLMPLTSSDAGSRQEAIRLLEVLTSRVPSNRLAAIRDLQTDGRLRSAIDSALARSRATKGAVS